MANESYTQCKMERTNADGSKSTHVAFIPTSFAKLGRNIEFVSNPDDDEVIWSKGWVVIERGATQGRVAVDLQRGAQKAFATKLDSKKRR